MAKQLNVNLAFNAETAQARKAIEDLSQSLRKIQVQPSRMFDDTDLKKASQAAQDLEKHLRAAVNVDTGKLDLNKFSQSLASSKQSLGDLYKDLSRAGAEGQAAFLNLAKSINAADSSTLNLGSKLRELSTTLKNTARWEISSKIMHGFESAISSAYGYAQDLNKSLTDIRIVTGANADEMARFAESANRAAKQLSTTTTDYTNASLIYFQQGLNDQEVAERTEVTIKMANAAGVSAQKVSDQMTAVWNNFDDGSKSLEYYADVMTALGAATASSTDEISEGLNKFAAVAETVGLSYEYATAALATVTSETRESADVVGTAYKTLFARIQGLQQGETLDDGTSLNKYSAALAKVGIDIKDVNGDMKDMDTILNEMGARWGTLAKDQQLALAQTVAGVRQYTQLVALMDNWGTFQENLNTAYNAEGALQEQADIYAESWEAASKRVQAAAEGIYQELLNDDFFIDILNGFEGFLTGINNVIDGVGGLKTILLSVGGIFLKQYAKEIPGALTALGDNLDVITGKAEKNRQKILQDNAKALTDLDLSPLSKSQKTEIQTMQKVSQMTVELEKNRNKLSEAELRAYQHKIEEIKLYGSAAVNLAKESEELEKNIKLRTSQIVSKGEENFIPSLEKTDKEIEKIKKLIEAQKELQATAKEKSDEDGIKKASNTIDKLDKQLKALEKTQGIIQEFGGKKDVQIQVNQLKQYVEQQEESLKIQQQLSRQAFNWASTTKDLKEGSEEAEKFNEQINKYLADIKKMTGINIGTNEFKELIKLMGETDGSTQQVTAAFQSWGQKTGIVDAFKNKIAALDEKITGLEIIFKQLGIPDEFILDLKESVSAMAQVTAEAEFMDTQINDAFSTNAQHTMQLSEAYGVMASTLMEVWGAVEAVKNLGSIWSDEDLTIGEKMFQTVSAMIPVIISMTSALGQQNRNQLASAAASISQAIGLNTTTVAEVAAAGATNTLNVSLGTLWSLLWPIALILGAVALAAWGLAEAFAAMKAASPEGQLAAAEEKSKELKTALEDAKTAADELNSSFDSYDSAVEALENCTKGTQEWRDALQNVNNEVLNLLSKYPELASMVDPETGEKVVGYGENGELTVSDYGREYLENQASQRVMATNAASVAANQDVREAQIKVDAQELASAINKVSGTTAYKTDYEGNIIDYSSMVAGYITKNAKELSGMTQEKQAEVIQSYLDANGIVADTQAWVDAISELGPEFSTLVNSIDANTAATKAENQAIATNALAGNDTIQDSKYASDIIATSGDIYGQLYEQKMKELEDEGWGTKGISKATGVNDEAKEVWRDYLKAAGLSETENYLVDTTGTDTNRQFVYGEDEKVITLEAMKEIVASANAIEALGGSAEEVMSVFTQLSSSGNEADQALQGLIANEDLSGATKAESEALKKAIDEAGGIESYLGAKLGGEDNVLSDKEAQAWGYDTAQKMIEALGAAVEGNESEWASVGDQLIGSVKTAFEESMSSGMFDGLSLEQTNQMANLFKSAFENAGPAGVSELQTTLGTMFEASGEDADELASILSSVDWQTTNVNELSQILEDAGIETEGLTNELANLIDIMKEGQNVGFDAAAEHYSSMKDYAGLEEGDTIEQADIDLLQAAGVDTSKYFKLMADGSYELCNDAEEFYRIVNEKSLDVFKSNLDALYEDVGTTLGVIDRRDENTIAAQNNMSGQQQTALVQDQLAFLEALNVEFANLASYQATIQEGGELSAEQLAEIQQLVEQNKHRWDELPASIQSSTAEIQKHQEAMINSTTSIDDLNRLLEDGYITLQQYNNSAADVMETEFEMEGLDPDAANEVAEAFREMAEAGVEGTECFEDNEEAVKDATVRYMELNEAITDIYDNFDDYNDILKDARKATNEVDKASIASNKNYKNLQKSLAGLIGTSEDFVDVDFISAIDPADFEAAANGSVDAIERIRDAFIKTQLEAYNTDIAFDDLKAELNELQDGAYLDLNTDSFVYKLIQAAIDAGATASEIESMLSGIGIDADVSEFHGSMEQMAAVAEQAGSRVVQATSFSQNVETEEVETPQTVTNYGFTDNISATPITRTNWISLGNGLLTIPTQSTVWEYTKSVTPTPVTDTTEDSETAISVETTNGAGESGNVSGIQIKGAHKAPTSSKTPSPTNTSRAPVSSGSGGGGSSKTSEPSKPKKIDTTKESDVVERYKEVTDALDEVADEMTKVQIEADQLWGKKHINNLKEQNELLDDQIELLERQRQEAEAYRIEDENDLRSAASALGVSLTIDPDSGDVTNIEDVEKSIYDQLAAAEAHYNSLTTGEAQDAYEETILEPLREKIATFEAARDLYYESLETAEDAEIAIEEAKAQKWANNFQAWSEGLEFEIEFNEKDLEMLEFWISRLEDNVYEMAEAAALMVGEMDDLASGLFGGQLAIYNENLQNADAALADLNAQFAAGEITEAAYHEGLDAIREQYMENIQALQDLDNTMMEYYENTLSAAQDELSKYTDQMEHQTEVLEHYQSLLELMGKSNDYKMIGEVLKGQVETTKNQATVSKQWYESRRADADALKADYEAAKQAGASDEELELLEKNWQDAEAVANEAQDQMLSDAEAWAEALKALLENELNDLGQTLENQLSGKWGSFDEMTTAMERANSLQEEYLTTTNQIYETNKLMRTAQQEIDKTTNSVAKKKLQAYINETQQLQDQSKLSQYELEIQQAKYNLLLAEIALEEAQDAKSTVRLQRDSEGNFGYVYTADSSKIAEAQQQLEDAQNDLYNIGLEGANGYAEKYQQTMAEMYDTLRDLQDQYQDGAFESEAEYQEAVTRATDYYYQQLKDFSSLYQISLTTDSRVIADAWSTDFADMTYQTEQWMTYVRGYNNDVIKAFKDWQDAVSGPGGVTDIVGNSVETVAGNVKDVTDKSKDLAEVTTETVIPALDNEIKAVANLTGEYAKLRDTIQEIITKYGLMIETINGNEENEYNSTEDGSNGGSSGNSNSNGGSSDGSSSSSSGDSNSGEGSTAATVTPATATVFYKGRKVKVNNDATTFSALSQNKTMDDWVPGEQFQAYSTSGDEVLIGDPKRAGTYTGWVNASDLTALNTGGYTGEWGPYGKLAMLHEKELILNPSDTANFLSSMEVLERILQIIDLQSASSQLGGILSSPGVRDTGSVIEQSIHIEASFPAAQNRNEIEEAFNNMFNKASQYANRK